MEEAEEQKHLESLHAHCRFVQAMMRKLIGRGVPEADAFEAVRRYVSHIVIVPWDEIEVNEASGMVQPRRDKKGDAS